LYQANTDSLCAKGVVIAESQQFWDLLLQRIDEGRVVPVVGPDLLTVTYNNRRVLLYPLLAKRLAEYLNVSGDDLPAGDEFNAIAYRLKRDQQPEDLYPALKEVTPEEEELEIPEPLIQLAKIRRFDLFLSTTFDPLLARALDQVRLDNQEKTLVLAYEPTKVEDLPDVMDRSECRVVYHLLGKLSAVPDFTLTQEDTLEFVHSLQSENRQPELLFGELERRSLLILGSRFAGWLARFFLRTAKGQRLLMARGRTDYIVDAAISGDDELADFLRHLPCPPHIYQSTGAVEFVGELHQRWIERHPETESASAASESTTTAVRPELRDGAVFLSYAHEDRQSVEKISKALDSAGIDVFFDKEALRGGNAFESKLIRAIESCSLFVPVISKSTLTKSRRFFRMEWKMAIKESRKAAESQRFIVPVVIDDTSPEEPTVPDSFRKLHWKTLPGGETSRQFVEQVKQDFRKYERSKAGGT